ncbi:MAG: MFS transporter [Rhodospirillaceae bacterium]|jgi:MFS family permease
MQHFSGLTNIIRALSQREYGIYAAGNLASMTGRWVQRIAIGWLTWELTKSGTWLGAMAAVDYLPTAIFAPLAGAMADKYGHLKLIKLVQWLSVGQAVGLFILMSMGLITVEVLLLFAFFLGMFTALGMPARLTIIPELAKDEHLPAAITFNTLTFHIGRFFGAGLGTFLISSGGPALAFATNAICFLIYLIALMMLRIEIPVSLGKDEPKLITKLKGGFQYAGRHPGIGPLMILICFFALWGRPVVDLFPAFADVVYKAGVEGLGVMIASAGVGAMIGGLWIAGRKEAQGVTMLLFGAITLGCAMILVFITMSWLWIAVFLIAVFGATETAVGVCSQTLLLKSTSIEMRGRIMSLYVSVFRATPAIGALSMGALSEVIGLRWAVFCGVLLIIFVTLWAWRRRHVMVNTLETDSSTKTVS